MKPSYGRIGPICRAFLFMLMATGSGWSLAEDTLAPVVSRPDGIVMEQSCYEGAVVTFMCTATDNADPDPLVFCFPPSGRVFPLGVTQVGCTGVDRSGNASNTSFTVTVRDTTDPVLKVPAGIKVDQAGEAGTVVRFTCTATDICDAAPTVTCNPASGSVFPLGTTLVHCVAVDASMNSDEASFRVVVSITYPTFSVSSPVGGDTFHANMSLDVTWEGRAPLGAVDIFLWKGLEPVAALAANMPAPAASVSCSCRLPAGLAPGDDYWLSVVDSDNAADFAESGDFSIAPWSVLLQKGDGGRAGIWQLGDDGRPLQWTAVCDAIPPWILRGLSDDVVLLQAGDGGRSGTWQLGSDGKPAQWTPMNDAIDTWILRDIDGNHVLLQQGIGGTCGIWDLGEDGKPAQWTKVSGPKPGWIARSLDGDRILLQRGTGGAAGIWTLNPDHSIGYWKPVAADNMAGQVLRSLDGNCVLLQAGDGGASGIWDMEELSDRWQPTAFVPVADAMPGWITRSLD